MKHLAVILSLLFALQSCQDKNESVPLRITSITSTVGTLNLCAFDGSNKTRFEIKLTYEGSGLDQLDNLDYKWNNSNTIYGPDYDVAYTRLTPDAIQVNLCIGFGTATQFISTYQISNPNGEKDVKSVYIDKPTGAN